MVSLGWGVVHDSLGKTLYFIVLLGVFYVGTSGAVEIILVVEVKDLQKLSLTQEHELIHDVVITLAFVVLTIILTFYMWILHALSGTMTYLKARNQSAKQLRYLRLRCILLWSFLFGVVVTVYGIVTKFSEDAVLKDNNQWVVDAVQVNYLFVLIGVAILWRPNPSAKEYAFVTELPALDTDDGDDGELAMMPSDIPSASDDNDDEDSHKDDFQYEPNQ
jgi:hypothetical protein